MSLGVATDVYQPAEEKYRVTRQILEVLKEHNCPFAIGTKSDLILRDLNLISEASEKSWCCVSLSITTLDENLAKLLEPNAPSPKRRLEALRRLSDEGITAGMWLAPIVPYVTDSNENIARVVEAAIESGARFVLGVGLDMRDPVRFERFLEEHFARLVPRYERLYKWRDRPCMYGLYRKFISLCQRYGVESYIPHFHTRRQAWLFYVRNFSRFGGTPVFELTQLLNYLSPLRSFSRQSGSGLETGASAEDFLRCYAIFHINPHVCLNCEVASGDAPTAKASKASTSRHFHPMS